MLLAPLRLQVKWIKKLLLAWIAKTVTVPDRIPAVALKNRQIPCQAFFHIWVSKNLSESSLSDDWKLGYRNPLKKNGKNDNFNCEKPAKATYGCMLPHFMKYGIITNDRHELSLVLRPLPYWRSSTIRYQLPTDKLHWLIFSMFFARPSSRLVVHIRIENLKNNKIYLEGLS